MLYVRRRFLMKLNSIVFFIVFPTLSYNLKSCLNCKYSHDHFSVCLKIYNILHNIMLVCNEINTINVLYLYNNRINVFECFG